MIDEPVPTMPEMVPATSPTTSTKRKFKDHVSCESGFGGEVWPEMQPTIQGYMPIEVEAVAARVIPVKTAPSRFLRFASAIPRGQFKPPAVHSTEMREV